MSASSVVASIRKAVHSIDKNLPVTDVETFRDVIGASVAQERFRTLLMTSFSALALLLAGVGIFGVISYWASQRAHEIGIRMALGAEQGDVLRLVVSHGMFLSLAGAAFGLVGARALTRFMSSLLYGVQPSDPLTFFAVFGILFSVALLGTYIPARRATKVDPMVALRHE